MCSVTTPSSKNKSVPNIIDRPHSYTGDVREQARTSVFAWEAAERGQEVHPVADPSQAEMLRKKFDEKKTTLKEVRRDRMYPCNRVRHPRWELPPTLAPAPRQKHACPGPSSRGVITSPHPRLEQNGPSPNLCRETGKGR